MSQNFKLLITCEHASNELPAFARKLNIPQETLESHRGYDIGASEIFRALVKKLHPDWNFSGKYSRLFIDLNRSLKNKNVFSEFWDNVQLPKSIKEQALAYYSNYRKPIEQIITNNINCSNPNPILHLSIHSFTPILNKQERKADIGILYDPSRQSENRFANQIIHEIQSRNSRLIIRRNYPYQGKTDGLCTSLRKISPDNLYAGIEIEINQKLFDYIRVYKN